MPLSPERIKELRTAAGVSPELPATPVVSPDVTQQRLAKFNAAVGTTETGEKGLKGFATGMGKGVLSTTKDLGSLTAKGLSYLPGKAGDFFQAGVDESKRIDDSEILKAKSTAEKVGKITETVAEFATPGTITKVAKGAEKLGAKILTKIADKSAEKSILKTIDAVNPELTGKNLTSAYKDIVTGKRGVTPPSIFREQGISANEQTVNLATRLHDLNLTNNPLKDLDKLKTGLSNTEKQIDNLIASGDARFNLAKDTLATTLEDAKLAMPREFSAIKDSKKIFKNVIDFAKEKIATAEDTIKGGREARSAFDAQAKREYPNAFKNGVVDTATPAGRAIKTARDIINKHIYTVAPEGGKLQELIGREADIFRATEHIAPKASKGHGMFKGKVGQALDYAKKNPIKTGLIITGADKALKSTTGIGL